VGKAPAQNIIEESAAGAAHIRRGGRYGFDLLRDQVRHSAFHSTALGYLLGQLDTERVVLTLQVTEQCIFYTALDAYIRHLSIVVPPDAVAPIDVGIGDAALTMMERNMHALIINTAELLS
jgi:nicotinamidase-related amidase